MTGDLRPTVEEVLRLPRGGDKLRLLCWKLETLPVSGTIPCTLEVRPPEGPPPDAALAALRTFCRAEPGAHVAAWLANGWHVTEAFWREFEAVWAEVLRARVP